MARDTLRAEALHRYAELFSNIRGRGNRLSAGACQAQAVEWAAQAAEYAAAALQGDVEQEVLFWRAKIASERWAREARRAAEREEQ